MDCKQVRRYEGTFPPQYGAGGVKTYVLVVLILASAMFPRVITALGAPKLINFLHFFFVVFVSTLLWLRKISYRNIPFLSGLTLLLLAIVVSAAVNGAGTVNVVLDFLLLSEPFLLLLAIISIPWSRASIKKFRFWLLMMIFVHISMAYYQHLVMGLINDDVEGVFLNMGAGSHLAGAVALTSALYLFSAFPTWPIWLRTTGATICSFVVISSDSKQVVAVFLVSLLIIIILRLKSFKLAIRYMAIAVGSTVLLIWAASTIFPALTVWASVAQIQEGLEQKLSVFPIIVAHYDSAFRWLFGLGPGHTVGRLGWILPDYYQYFQPLGATISPVTSEIWHVHQGHYMSNATTGSSMFSLLFSWSGVWGDLGIVGLLVYLYLWFLVWRKLCLDELSRFCLISIIVFGGVFSWMEEPGYMLFVTSIIGVQWQEKRKIVPIQG